MTNLVTAIRYGDPIRWLRRSDRAEEQSPRFEFDAPSGAQYTQLMAVITESPRTMLMTPLATSLIGFVPEDDTGWPEVEVSQPSKGTAQPPPAACTDEAGSTQDAASSTDGDAGSVSSAIEGDWLLCSGPRSAF